MSRFYKQKRGMVLMVVLTTITLMIVIVQQIAFDTQVEYKNGASHYHSLRAYHAAKSGVELALLKIMTYRKIHQLLDNRNLESVLGPQGKELVRQYTDQIWQAPFAWPPVMPPDLSDIRQGEVQDLIGKSLLDMSYNVQITAENSRINLNDMVSPIPQVREWTRNIFYNLLIHLRNQHVWLQEKHSVNDMRDIQQNIIQAIQDPSHSLGRPLTHFSELEKIEGISPELIEWIRPYISFYAIGGIHLQYANPMIMQSLHENIEKDMAEQLVTRRDNTDQQEENPWVLSEFNQVESLWANQNLNFLIPAYKQDRDNEPALHTVVFNYDAPQNFRITSRGTSGQNFHVIEAVFYDPHSTFKRIFNQMTELKSKSGYRALQKGDPGYQEMMYESDTMVGNPMTSPFIIYWKDVN
ncbi:MAG: type II secretion system protein GspK [Bdellovibrionales bacterium]|nr:type II secretion system protein GspK [Bdellovibrionales bacterium]